MASQISLCFLAFFAVVLVCTNAATMQKRDTEQSLAADANQALDKFFEDINKGIKQLAKDGIDVQSIFNNISTKANELGTQIQHLGKELGEKVQTAAKDRGIGS